MNESFFTAPQMLENSRKYFGPRPALRMRKEEGGYREYSYNDFYDAAQKVGAFLTSNGLKHGDKVALLSENRPEWPITYFGIANIGGVIVPFDPKLTPEEIAALIKDSGAKFLFVSDTLKEKVENIQSEDREIEKVFNIDKELLSKLKNEIPVSAQSEINLRKSNVKPDDLLCIIYTSGTTGNPKGVMLTHKNIMSNVTEAAPLFKPVTCEDVFLSVLPAYHTFETTAGMFYPLYIGASVTYAESLKSYNLLRNMVETRVSVMCGVPLLYSLFLDGIKRQIGEKGIIAKSLVAILKILSSFFKNFWGANAGKILFGFIHKKFGGRIKMFVAGGAALDPDIINEFDLMGFTILQGYGLTETSPVLSACRFEDNVFGTVGKPLPGIDIKIHEPNKDGIGEIIARGPNIMKGYYKNPQATNEVIKNGWFHTGDLGKFDANGNLVITGRSKDVIVLGSGVNVYPDEVEFVLSKSPFIQEICVFGAVTNKGAHKGMEVVSAAIKPDMEYFEKKFGKERLEKDKDLVGHTISGEVDALSKGLTEYKKVAGFFITHEELPKTATKKIKRFVVKQIFS